MNFNSDTLQTALDSIKTINTLEKSYFSIADRKISTGITPLDANIGGGFPLSKIIEIAGAESQGKSSFALSMSKSILDNGGIVKYVDCENSWEYNRIKAFGLPDTYEPIIPYTQDDGYNVMMALCNKIRAEFMAYMATATSPKAGKERLSFEEALAKWPVTLIVWDTFSSKPMKIELEGNKFGDGIASRPRANKAFLMALNTVITGVPVLVLLLNQVMSTIGKFGGGVDSPGGQGLKHFAHVRMFLNASSRIFNSDTSTTGKGLWVRFSLVKSKISPPWSKIHGYLDLNKGFNDYLAIYDFLDRTGVIKTAGSWKNIMSYKGKGVSFRVDTWEKMCAEDPLFYEYVQLLVYEKMAHDVPLTLGTLYENKIKRLNEIRGDTPSIVVDTKAPDLEPLSEEPIPDVIPA